MGTQKDATQQFTFRIPVDLKAEMERIAKEEERTLSKQIIMVLRNFVKENAKGN